MESNPPDQTRDQGCSDEQLLDMLNSQLGPEHFTQLLERVESCSHCQQRLEQLAAESTFWSDAAVALAGYSSSDNFHGHIPTMQLRGLMDNHQQATHWTEAMAKQLLSTASHPEMLGRIGRYDVERLIGAGGMGIVFKAFDSELNRAVAIKLLAPYLAGNGSARQRFSREAKAAAAVVHEHVVPIHNVETDGDCPYLVMRYVSGESLQQRIDRDGPLDTCQVLRIAKQIASGLAAAHAQGLIHRDIKPSNILVESGVERSLITDFGLARAGDDASLTNTGHHPGTPQYMSPEQARGDSIDARSDLFSLGSLMYAMCTGRAPFRAETSYGILRKITDNEPQAIQDLNPNIPVWLSAIVAKLMSKKVEARFQSAAEVEQLLEGCLAHVQRPTVHKLPVQVAELYPKSKFKSNRLASTVITGLKVAGAVAAVIALAAMAISLNRSTKQESESRSKTTPQSVATNLQSPKTSAFQDSSLASRPRVAASTTEADLLRLKLAQPAKVSVKDASLAQAVSLLFEGSQIDFEINRASFEQRSRDLDAKITLNADGPLRDLLHRVLQPAGASYIVRDRFVEVVAEEYARVTPVLRQYDLSFVLSDSSFVDHLSHGIEGLIGNEANRQTGRYSVSVVDSILVVRAPEVDHVTIENLLAQVGMTFQPVRKK